MRASFRMRGKELPLLLWVAAALAVVSMPGGVEARGRNSGTLTLCSDYVFRGISQNHGHMALEGELVHELADGTYFGAFSAKVSELLYNGSSMEFDFWAGHRARTGKDSELDLCLIRYGYLGQSEASPIDCDTTEIYLAWKRKGYGLRYSRSLTDLFGVSSSNPLNLTATANGSSKGSSYFEASFEFELRNGVGATIRAGRQRVVNYDDASYTDYGFKLSRSYGDHEITLAFSDSNADRSLYTLGGEYLGDRRSVLAVAWTF